MSHEYENLRRAVYGRNGPMFIPVCPKCGRFVKADGTYSFSENSGIDHKKPNATCKKCGRIAMPFDGWDEDEEND